MYIGMHRRKYVCVCVCTLARNRLICRAFSVGSSLAWTKQSGPGAQSDGGTLSKENRYMYWRGIPNGGRGGDARQGAMQ